jgi:hypothetical protein
MEINNNAKPADKIYVGSSFVYFTFKYYNQTLIHPLLYSPGNLEAIPFFSGTPLLTNNDLVLDLKKTTVKNDTVWLVWTDGFNSSKPNVPGNWQKTDEKISGDAPDFKGNIYVTKYLVK